MQEKNPNLEVIVCTIDDGIENVRTKLLPQLHDVAVLISHQYTDEKFLDKGEWSENVRYVSLPSTGLSKNRNNGLRYATGEIVLLSDDDVVYEDGFVTAISEAYRRHETAAAITFQSKETKRWSEEFLHNWRTVGQVSSVGITFRPQWVRQQKIVFDEDFGLGAKYPQGEENIFLADIRRQGGEVWARPEVIVGYTGVSSGYNFTPEIVTAKIAVVRRMYGRLAALAALAVFAVTKHKHYTHQMSFWQYIAAASKGIL